MTVSAAVLLVVEDEFLVRLHAIDTLEAAGFATLEAANADEAILILESRTDIRIVITDIDMPGSMDGLKLARGAEEVAAGEACAGIGEKEPLD
jgi:CheY-like chemotaxis protein